MQQSSLARQEILKAFKINDAQPMATGTEAEVYALPNQRVLKLYTDPNLLDRLLVLQDFYLALDSSACGFEIPILREILPLHGMLATVEDRILGVSLETLLAQNQHSNAVDLYFESADALAKLRFLRQPSKYLLFDQTERSAIVSQSWPQFYSSLVGEKLLTVGTDLANLVEDFSTRSSALLSSLRDSNCAQLCIVHGDFFPGNLMVTADLSRTSGVIDFGQFTLFGDHILDLAGALGFYRMYDANRAQIREQNLPKVLALVKTAEQPKLFRYLLAIAIVTCDLYVKESNLQDNGHYHWAVEILNNASYWQRAL